jgi:hypothetical protein
LHDPLQIYGLTNGNVDLNTISLAKAMDTAAAFSRLKAVRLSSCRSVSPLETSMLDFCPRPSSPPACLSSAMTERKHAAQYHEPPAGGPGAYQASKTSDDAQ